MPTVLNFFEKYYKNYTGGPAIKLWGYLHDNDNGRLISLFCKLLANLFIGWPILIIAPLGSISLWSNVDMYHSRYDHFDALFYIYCDFWNHEFYMLCLQNM